MRRPAITIVDLKDLPFAGINTDWLFVPPDPDYEPPWNEIIGVRLRPGEEPVEWSVYHDYDSVGSFETKAAAIAAWERAEAERRVLMRMLQMRKAAP